MVKNVIDVGTIKKKLLTVLKIQNYVKDDQILLVLNLVESISIGSLIELLGLLKLIIYNFSFFVFPSMYSSSLKILLVILELISLDYLLNQFFPFSEKQEFLPFLGNLIIDH